MGYYFPFSVVIGKTKMEPIAKRLNRSAEAALAAATKKQSADDVAEQIKRLEAELQRRSDDSSSDSSDDSDSETNDDSDSSSSSSTHNGSKRPCGAVLSLSAYANERVEGLPEHLLPKLSATAANLTDKKRKREVTSTNTSLLDELQWTKRVPFACKPCGFVGKNLEEFQAHRASTEHLARQESVETVLMCKLCDKKFTSPQQLADHKVGKWHLQRAQQRKDRHVVKVCYDFMRGSCKWGDRCNFEHAETKAMKKGKAFEKTKKRLCESFQRTQRCKYGDQCLFSHDSS